MVKKNSLSPRHAGLAILAGALSFTGSASAVIIFSENFEAINAFGAPTYNYSQHYTLPNTLTPGGGNTYGTGVSGLANNTLLATGSPFSLLVGGITPALIDSGNAVYNLFAQFSTYTSQNDFGEITVKYLDASNAQVGMHVIGGLAVVSALGSGTGEPPENIAGVRDWAADQFTGTVPAGARSATIEYSATRQVGNAADAYVDNISFTVNAVPEPSTALAAILASSVLAIRRRPRDAK